jgi:hypothetical protein
MWGLCFSCGLSVANFCRYVQVKIIGVDLSAKWSKALYEKTSISKIKCRHTMVKLNNSTLWQNFHGNIFIVQMIYKYIVNNISSSRAWKQQKTTLCIASAIHDATFSGAMVERSPPMQEVRGSSSISDKDFCVRMRPPITWDWRRDHKLRSSVCTHSEHQARTKY